jgi:WD40 repeat protein/transcriptional regulator with XRE-family HTH domain
VEGIAVSDLDIGPGERFRGLLLQLRGRIGLTQRELADLIQVHRHSIQAWETGVSFPGIASLRALIKTGLHARAFTPGVEAAEAADLWQAAMRGSSRLRTPFDGAWFASLQPAQPTVNRTVAGRASPGHAPPPSTRVPPAEPRRQYWSAAPDVDMFLGRAEERALLRRWVLVERCRAVAVLGMGGIGKTLLTTRLARDLAPDFDAVYWRSLRDAPSPDEWLAGALSFLAPDDAVGLGDETRTARLIDLLRRSRCLVILDNVETILDVGARGGQYTDGNEGYGPLLRQLGEASHQSCVILTSREAPPELAQMRSTDGPVRAFHLSGLGVDEGRALLTGKLLDGDDAAWQTLIQGCGGNALALMMVGELVHELFGGSIAAYLDYAGAAPSVTVSGIRQLVESQIGRLSTFEHEVVRWLAVEREAVSFRELAAALGVADRRGSVLEAIEALRRRSLVERSELSSRFTLHSVVMEYVTDELIEAAVDEIHTRALAHLLRRPLIKATAKDYVRRSQERLIAQPIVERLTTRLGGAAAVERSIVALVDRLRGAAPERAGYGPGNLANLLRLVHGDLRALDLSRLALRQVALHETEAQDANLSDASLTECVLAEAFNNPTAMALSLDGSLLIAGTSTGEVCVWRVAERALAITFQGHGIGIRGVAISGDNRLVASGSIDGSVRLWEVASGRQVSAMQGHAGLVYHVALSVDGRVVASAGQDGTIRVWDAASGDPRCTFDRGGGGNWGVSLSDDGARVAGGSWDGAIRVWDTQSGSLVATLGDQSDPAMGLAMTRDGRLVASGSFDGTVNVWDVRRGVLAGRFEGHVGGVRGISVDAGGQRIASGSYDGTVKLWDVDSGRLQATLQGHSGGIWDVALSGDGTHVASGSFDGSIRLWETGGGRIVLALHGYNIGIRSVAASKDGRLVVGGSYDGTVRLWDPTEGRLIRALRGHTSGIRGVAVSDDGRLVVSGSFDETIKVWDTASGQTMATLPGHGGGVWGVGLSGDGRLAAGGSYDGTIRVWDVASARHVGTFQSHTSGSRSIALSEDGQVLVAGSEDRIVRVWETATGNMVTQFEGHAGGAWGVAVSADGRVAASGSDDGTARIWETRTGREIASLSGHTNSVWGVALTADGAQAATASFDGTVRLWDALSGRLIAAFEGHQGGVWGVALSADGRLVASGGVDGTIRIWDPERGVGQFVLRGDRRYERLDITGLTGVNPDQRRALLALGAGERQAHART